MQLDDPHEPKPSPLPNLSIPSCTNTWRTRNRFANFFYSNKRTDTGLSTIDANNEAADNNGPMHIISPRATTREPAITPRKRQHTFTLKLPRSNRESTKPISSLRHEDSTTHQSERTSMVGHGVHIPVTEVASTHQLEEVTAYDPENVPVVRGGKHIPVTNSPHPYQPHNDRVGMGSLTRETALTSHPVMRAQEAENGEKSTTPIKKVPMECLDGKE